MNECSCQTAHVRAGELPLESFSIVRSCCPALRSILVPDDLWLHFQEWHRQPDQVAYHRSILLLAMERGHLNRVTCAVHRYLIAAGLPRADVRQQYLNDLRERWMYYSDPEERHEKFRMFFGRLVELQCAEWLESQGWTISSLEAFRKGPDIVGSERDRTLTAFEVKFIGVENEDFKGVLESLAGRPSARSVSPYVAANYLVFRAYEAAKQLEGVTGDHIAILVLDDQTWHRFDLQLKNGWIKWTNASFFPGDQTWRSFLARQQTRYPAFPADLRPTLMSLQAVWVLRLSYGYQYDRVFETSISVA